MLAAAAAKTVGAAVAGSIGATATLTATASAWASFGASVATIIGCGVALWGLNRRRRRRFKPPTPPPHGATLDEWDDYSIRVDQWAKDQEGKD